MANNHEELKTILDEVSKTKHSILNLSHRGIKVIPADVSKLIHVRTLLLNNNSIIMPPEEIVHLDSLEHLSLEYNQLTLLPSNIHRLAPTLTFLNLSYNPLMYLPPSLAQMINLKELWLGHTGLANFPKELGHLVQLEKLSVEGNDLSDIDDSLNQLENLKWLSLAGNCFRNVQQLLLRKLEVIILAENQLTSFPTFFVTDFHGLEYIDLKKNKLSSLPEDITSILSHKKLARIDLRNNFLEDSDVVVSWKKIEFIIV